MNEFLINKPLPGFDIIYANQKNFLHRASTDVLAFQPGGGGVLHLEAGRGFAAANLNPTGYNSAHVGTVFDNAVENLIQPTNPAMLTFDSTKLHREMIRAIVDKSVIGYVFRPVTLGAGRYLPSKFEIEV